MKHFTKNLLVWAILLACIMGLFTGCSTADGDAPTHSSDTDRTTQTPSHTDRLPQNDPTDDPSQDIVRDPEQDISMQYFWLSSDDGSCNYMRFMYHRACYYAYKEYSWMSSERYNQLLRNYYDLSGPYYLTGTVVWIEGDTNYTIMLIDNGGCIYVANVLDYVRLVPGDQVTVYGELCPGSYMKDGVEMRAPMIEARDYYMGYDTENSVGLGVLLDSVNYQKPNKVYDGRPDLADYIYDYWMETLYVDGISEMYYFDGNANTINGYHYTVHYWYVNPMEGSMLLMVHIDGLDDDLYTYFIFKYDDLTSYTISSFSGSRVYTDLPFTYIEKARIAE